MGKRFAILTLLLLIAAGGWLRSERIDWNKEERQERTGIRLTREEAAYDKKARMLLHRDGDMKLLQAQASSRRFSGLSGLGYPLFLAAGYRAFGSAGLPPLAGIQTIQLILDLATALLLYAAISFLLSRRFMAMAVSALYLVHPAFTAASGDLVPGTLQGFIQAMILCCFILFFRRGEHSPYTGLICGTAFAVGILLHPAVFPFLLLFIGLAGLRCFYTRRNVAPYLAALASCLLLLSPWWIRLCHTPERWVIVSQLKPSDPLRHDQNGNQHGTADLEHAGLFDRQAGLREPNRTDRQNTRQ